MQVVQGQVEEKAVVLREAKVNDVSQQSLVWVHSVSSAPSERGGK